VSHWDILAGLLTPTTKGEFVFWGLVLLIILFVVVAVGSFALGWAIVK
jgi:hypothetical protein